MKKNYTLLFLLLGFSCLSQKPSGVLDMNMKLEAMFYPKTIVSSSKIPTKISEPSLKTLVEQKTNAPILSAVFYRLTGSQDMLGNIVSHSKPLQYNTYLQAFSFITRKSPTYLPSSNGNSGTIVGFIGKNNASTNNIGSWDSTCLWTNTLNIAQTAIGAIWKPTPGNQGSLATSYLVAAGSVKNGTTITGSYRASKLIGAAGTNTPGADMQFFSNTPPFTTTTSPQINKHDETDLSFESTDQAVWLNGMIYNDVNGNDEVARGLRGMHISKGIFTSGVMVWNNDSIIPPAEMKTNGVKALWRQSHLKFTPDGNIGYAVFVGVRQGNPLNSSNRGMQPIIYKTTNAGTTWNLVNGIDFNNPSSPTFSYVMNSLDPVSTSTVKVPYFNPTEGIDITIDENGKLHILSTVCSTAKQHIDSLSYIHQYNNGGETYSWPHTDGKRPYIIDFVGDGASAWQCNIIDSLDTECPSNIPSMPGYTNNPWANQSQSVAISSGARLQLSKSICGNLLLYSWAESDTNLTTDSRKFNEFPNLKLRSRRICDDVLSPDEFNVTGLPSTLNAIKDKAYFHYVTPEINMGAGTATSATVMIGIVVSNNVGHNASLPARHYFSSGNLQYSFPSGCGGPWQTNYNCFPTSIAEQYDPKANFDVYPIPALKELTIEFKRPENNTYQYNITDLAGKTIKTGELQADQKTTLSIQGLNSGVYILSIRDGERLVGVKKFVKE